MFIHRYELPDLHPALELAKWIVLMVLAFALLAAMTTAVGGGVF